MAIQNLTMTFPIINFSANVGDIVYYSHSGAAIGGFDSTDLSNTRKLGEILEIERDPPGGGNPYLTVQYDDALTTPPSNGDYISFAKDKRVNTSSLAGYYISAKFINNSKKKAELFSVASNVTESSK
tara:strand:+ start:538 stop:918 length:381 start_codon:yes stop_codon:yes gene_type:complete